MTQYTMLHRMGKGSYGKVYKALGPDGLVAIKLVPAPSDNDAQKLKDIQGEIDTLKAEVQLLRRALQDERRVSALRMQAERRLAEAEQGQGALQQELGALSAELMRAASLEASSGLMLRS